MLKTTIKHPFTDDDDHPDTDAFYQTLIREIDELIDTTNFRESSISISVRYIQLRSTIFPNEHTTQTTRPKSFLVPAPLDI